jgi:hypothetical protein
MLSVLKRYLNDEDINEYYYDSDDDPVSLVGMKIEVKWAQNKYYAGMIEEYNGCENEIAILNNDQGEGQHRVVYDDGDIKWHQLHMKNWRFA